MHLYFVLCTIHMYTIAVHMYTIAAVHLDFCRALQVSRPDIWAYIQIPYMQCVCVRVQTHTQHIHINTL
jgi:hypothetical protein